MLLKNLKNWFESEKLFILMLFFCISLCTPRFCTIQCLNSSHECCKKMKNNCVNQNNQMINCILRSHCADNCILGFLLSCSTILFYYPVLLSCSTILFYYPILGFLLSCCHNAPSVLKYKNLKRKTLLNYNLFNS